MDRKDFFEKIEQAEMILVGLGEDFDGIKLLRQRNDYEAGCNRLKEEGRAWLIPAWNEYCLEEAKGNRVRAALDRLDALLVGKNYFVVSVSTNSNIAGRGKSASGVGSATNRRVVMPCGSILQKQCTAGCEEVLLEVGEAEKKSVDAYFRKWDLTSGQQADVGPELGICHKCGAPLIFNTIYAENYNEKGYLDQWELYKKWLQGTLNRRLLILELGVGLRFPSVIRWPFEKTAFFNQKAYFYRVHEKLYQLTKELAGKGCGISEDAVDWLAQL